MSLMMKHENEKFCACYDRDYDDVFFASLIFFKGSIAQLKSSYQLEKANKIVLVPVPKGWNGEKIPKEEIVDNLDSLEATVTRNENKGVYQIRIFSNKDFTLMDQVRTVGKVDDNSLCIQTTFAGLVGTLFLRGTIGISSAARIQKSLYDMQKQCHLVVLDLSELNYFANAGIAMLYTLMKELANHGLKMKLVVKEGSHIHNLLRGTKIDDEFELCFNRDIAVALLLSTELE